MISKPAGRPVTVLLVDQAEALEQLAAELAGEPLDVHTAECAVDALLLVGRHAPDAVVAGPLEGRLNLVALVEALKRNEPELPVVVGLRPHDGELAAGLAALEPAAVIGYPFRAAYLARLLQSLAPVRHRRNVVDLGRLQIDGNTPEIRLDGMHLVLPLREFLLLSCLADHAGRVVSRAEIGEAVWGRAELGTSNTVAVHVARLRRRLGGNHKGERWIKAVRGIGYQLTVPPTPTVN